MTLTNFDSENLKVDWLSFNLEGLVDPGIIANHLSKHFIPHVLIDNVPSISFHGLKKKYKVSVRQSTGSKSYWVGTQIIFSGKGAGYIATRTRIAICLLTVSGIRISELLSLKVFQLKTLLEEGWISIDRLKRGPANHKAFLTSEGRKIVKARKRDFEFLFLMKDEDSYIFTSDRKPNQKLGRQQITMDVNRVMHSVSNLLPSKPNITSHSFRIGYISQLWKDTKDIEFVRQTIGHRSLNSTSNYVSDMGNEERENRISRI